MNKRCSLVFYDFCFYFIPLYFFDRYKFLSFRLFVSPPRVPFFKENVIFSPPCLLSRVDFLLQRELPNFNRCKTKFMDFLLFLLNLENEAWANLELSDMKIFLCSGPLTGQNCNVFAYTYYYIRRYFFRETAHSFSSITQKWEWSNIVN